MAIFAIPETQAKRAMKLMVRHSSHNFSTIESDILIKSFTSLTLFIKSNRFSADGLRGVNDIILKQYLDFKSTTNTKDEIQQERVAIEAYISLQKKVFAQ